jgi:hypothetical protein
VIKLKVQNKLAQPAQSVFALSPSCCVLSREATNTNFIVFGLTQSRLKPMIYRTQGEHANHYTTDTKVSGSKKMI